MCPVIAIPTSSEIHSMICFLQAERYSTDEIHCKLYGVYSDNIVNDNSDPRNPGKGA